MFDTVSDISQCQMYNGASSTVQANADVNLLDLSNFELSGNDLVLDSINYANRESMKYRYIASSGS